MARAATEVQLLVDHSTQFTNLKQKKVLKNYCDEISFYRDTVTDSVKLINTDTMQDNTIKSFYGGKK